MPRRSLVVLLPAAAVAAALAASWWLAPRDHLELWTVLDDASGMKTGKPVTLSGVQIGEIRRVSLTDDDRARVDFTIDREHAHRMRGARDAAACAEERGQEAQCGTTVESALMPTFSTMLAPRGLIVHPGRGRALVDGERVPSVERKGFATLLETLEDERVVRELPLEMAKTMPALRALTRSMMELSEGLQKRSPVRGLLGGQRDDDPAEEQR